jgi:hypothetical protein
VGVLAMNRTDWIFVGLKLLGAYFAVYGAIALIAIIGGMILSLQQKEFSMPVYVDDFLVNWFQFLQPIVYLTCAFMLIRRTNWCLGWICFEEKNG